MPASELSSTDRSIDEAPTLSEEELDVVKQRMAALDKIFAEEQKAKYKIELMFGKDRKQMAATPGMISFWESGAKLHGGGDCKIYICAGKSSGKSNCEGFIPDASSGYGFLMCPKCKEVWKGPEVTGEIFARLTMQNWAYLLYKYFVRLEHNADIYIKHPRADIRVAALQEQERQRGGEVLGKTRGSLTKVIYPLSNIIRDTANGADTLKRFYALLLA